MVGVCTKVLDKFRGLRKEGVEEEKKNEHKEENQPAEPAHGEDNTDKTADQLQQGEEVPQARRLIASSQSILYSVQNKYPCISNHLNCQYSAGKNCSIQRQR